MHVRIQCPGCFKRWLVPLTASGGVGRCRVCGSRFRLPTIASQVDETVIGWLVHSDHDDEDDDAMATATEAPVRQITHEPAAAPSLPPPEPAESPAPQPVAVAPEPATYDVADPPVAVDLSSRATLCVRSVNTAGVKLTFSAKMLKNDVFRASMPLRCLSCGTEDRDKLTARPIVWIDRSMNHVPPVGEIEQTHKLHVRDRGNATEVMALMLPIDELSPPFNLPMPYFVCTDCAAHVHVHGAVHTTPTGVDCEVMIPSSAYALRWIERVNGFMDGSAASLRAAVQKLDTPGWRAVPQNVRERLAAWFSFADQEQFLAYLPDSEFTARDAGYAGIIVTNQRLVYHKYSHSGALPLDAPGELQLACDGVFCDVTYTGGRVPKTLVRLRAPCAGELAQTLAQLKCPLQVAETDARLVRR
ncbi:MAG: hypothetical protein GC162_03140 [Planctomycetes bacterium]|nr:hypothetical protein [Planctomycetota bacterium]